MGWKERYQIISPIHETFKSALFLAHDLEKNKKVLLRVLYHNNAEYYRILQKINSPHLPQIFEVVLDQDDTIVVEEYIQGQTLEQMIVGGLTFSFEEIVNILIQLCRALDEIHSRGIIHRDIKPSNIMIHGDHVLLIDFDAARLYHRSSHKKDTVYIGTEGYAAPEQYGFSQTDSRSDIYALGVVLKELLGENQTQGLSPIIRKCTAFDPENRYDSVKGILKDLEIMGLYRENNRLFENTSELAAVTKQQTKTWPCISKSWKVGIALFLGIMTIVLFIPQSHEITVTDYILSKLVYLQIVIFPAIILFNFFHIWQRAPLLRSPQKKYKIWGIVVYIIIFLAVIIAFQILATIFYSPQAKHVLYEISSFQQKIIEIKLSA